MTYKLSTACLSLYLLTIAVLSGRDPARGATNWPDEKTTGVPANVVLKPSGALFITKPDTVISGLDIHGMVVIKAPRVRIVNCRISVASFSVVQILPGAFGATVEHSEINGLGHDNEGSNGINGQGTFLSDNIYNVENGMNITGPSKIQDNYIHDLLASGSPHYDGIQIDGGHDIAIIHNTIINSHEQTSAVMIDNYFSAATNIAVDDNRLQGGGYTVYSDGQFKGGPIQGISFTNNYLGKGRWGFHVFRPNNPVWSGNVDLASGKLIGPP